MVGESISHYKILEELGRGGMGIVYRAEDTRLDRTVAIKVLSTHLDSVSAAKKRFLHESRIASSLDHPNVGNIHAMGIIHRDIKPANLMLTKEGVVKFWISEFPKRRLRPNLRIPASLWERPCTGVRNRRAEKSQSRGSISGPLA